jgi:hypothetical protein
MTPEEIKSSLRDMINAMVKQDEPESQEQANTLIRDVIRAKAAAIVSPPAEVVTPDVDADGNPVTTETPPAE